MLKPAALWEVHMKIAVLIPCYNESKTIAKVVDDYRAGRNPFTP